MAAHRKPHADPFYERGLPANVEAERSILGAILLDNNVCNQAVEMLEPEDLFLDSHRRIYDRMVALYERGSSIDLITLGNELRNGSEFEQVGGATYISSLIDGVPRTDTIEHYAKIVLEKSARRKLINGANATIQAAFDEEEEIAAVIDQAQQNIGAVVDRTLPGQFRLAADVARLEMERVEQFAGRTSMITGVATGFTDFDQMTSGLQKENLIIVAARPSAGKTAIALNMAQYAAKNGNTVGIFSLEMSAEELVQRLISGDARIDAHRLRTGHLNREEWARIADALRRLSEQKIYLEDTAGLTVSQMRAKSRRLQAQHGLDLLLVDYLQLAGCRSKAGRTRQEEVSEISRDLKGLAKTLKVPVIAMSQLSRAPDLRSDHRPQLSDLRESGSLEQDGDVICFIYREEMYAPTDENRGVAELIIGKQRNGPTGTVQLAFLREFTRFENMYRE